jgi:hypothetical protein
MLPVLADRFQNRFVRVSDRTSVSVEDSNIIAVVIPNEWKNGKQPTTTSPPGSNRNYGTLLNVTR